MSQLAIKQFCVTTAATASLANTQWANGSIHSYRQRPKQEKLGGNVVVLAGRTIFQGTRYAGSRGPGSKKRVYQQELLVYAVAKDEQQGGDDFDTLLERIANALESCAVPVEAIDPSGNSPNTAILEVAEHIDSETLDPITTAAGNQSLVRFYGIVKPKVTEIYKG